MGKALLSITFVTISAASGFLSSVEAADVDPSIHK